MTRMDAELIKAIERERKKIFRDTGIMPTYAQVQRLMAKEWDDRKLRNGHDKQEFFKI